MKALGYITATIIIAAYTVMMQGWALSKLWLWFIVPTFGLVAISIPAAIGLALVVGYMCKVTDTANKEKKYEDALIESLVIGTLKPLFCLLFGAIVRNWL